MRISERVSRFNLSMSDDELDARIRWPAKSINSAISDPYILCVALEKALNEMFEPDLQVRNIIRNLLSQTRSYAEIYFGSDEEFIAKMYSKSPWGMARAPAICLTGIAGVGKSALLLALLRLLPLPEWIKIPGHNLPLVSSWPLSLSNGTALSDLLGEFVLPKDEGASRSDVGYGQMHNKIKRIGNGSLLRLARKIAWRDSVCLLSVDEFQWVAAGDDANARASKLLLTLHGIGPLFVFCSNYSLVNKLAKRTHEDRQRLLSRPIVMQPLSISDPGWIAYLHAVKSVAPVLLNFDPMHDAETIHRYTFGIKRLVVLLVVAAVKLARTKNPRATVDVESLKAAYNSAEYSANRRDVEDLIKQGITGKAVRADLWCPFRATPNTAKVVSADSAIASFERRTQEALLVSALSPAEANAHAAIAASDAATMRPGKVVRLARSKVTKASLLEGAAALDEFIKHPRS